ncbi:hypothetical protein TARUN_9097 [Trichoderma arundinaceum]|uniref:Uncharacterized protein n=1 Tax=Trichoderma arundinaceum TaxID=490622 RepID=A0A395NAM3_TRIAR|nr:hypothetical protein TARUN_9097 [Trichoderma arundinaceum]
MLRRGVNFNFRDISWNRPVANASRVITREFASASRKPAASKSNAREVYPSGSTKQHSNLASFLEYAKRAGLDEKSTFFTGTRYEYLVAERLARYGFSLQRVGGASDFGIDLLGHWTIPSTSQTVRVLVQCKAGAHKKGPHFIRELEGSFVGAPPGWRGSGVLGLMVAEREATKGVRDAVGRSNLPMGYFCCSRDGVVRQMLWNQRAEEEGLEGIGVGLRRGSGEKDSEVVLMKNGEPLPFVE